MSLNSFENEKCFKKENKQFERRIYHIINIIKNYDELDWKSSKKYYLNLLKKEISIFYHYSLDLINRFFHLIPIEEIFDFFKFNEKPRPLTFRINTIKIDLPKIKKILTAKGIFIFTDPHFSEFAALLKGKNLFLGGNIEYLAGYYTLQGLSSLFPVLTLNPGIREKILDLSAAPGGKSTYISQLMNNTGILVANDINKFRIKSLVSTVHRLGVENSIVTNYDGSIFPYVMRGFDRVLVDGPCTGTGIISHDNRIKYRKINSSILINSFLQKRLLISAIDTCNPKSKKGGYIVYSTCSILAEENECVIQYAIEKRNVKIVPTGLNFGLPGYTRFKNKTFDKKMKYSKRFYPHIHNIDGFFVCKLKKF